MRFVVIGAGAVGGVLAARLQQAGERVVVVARGAHLTAIQQGGLVLHAPEGTSTVALQAVGHPEEIGFEHDDVVLLTVKGHDTEAALRDLAVVAPPPTPVVCVQNGVANEGLALLRFHNVYGAVPMIPTTFLEPGTVSCHCAPWTGVIDLGRYPWGTDEIAAAIVAALRRGTFDARVVDDLGRWRYGKLLDNLSNVIEALCGPLARRGRLAGLVAAEAQRCFTAAGIDWASADERAARRASLQFVDVAGGGRPGGSAWQSLARGAGSIEVDELNGEIVLLGRVHGVPTPANELVQRFAHRATAEGRPAGAWTEDELLRQLWVLDATHGERTTDGGEETSGTTDQGGTR